jgi:predicted nucleic acid-binding protein
MVTFFPVNPHTPRVFFDSSVMIAGSVSRTGASKALLLLSEIGLIRPVVCPYVFNETERNLRKKVARALPDYQQLRAKIDWEVVPDPPGDAVSTWVGVIALKDVPVLAAAVIAKPDRLVTLNVEDFLKDEKVAQQSGLNIVTPGELLREIRQMLAQGFKR